MESRRARHRAPLKLLGAAEFGVLVANLSVMGVLFGILLWPQVYADYIERFGIMRFESAYGFRTGRMAVAQEGEDSWAITWVAPDGELASRGLRAGDVPVEYHGGIFAFYRALLAADRGEAASFEVINISDWPTRRVIEIPGRCR